MLRKKILDSLRFFSPKYLLITVMILTYVYKFFVISFSRKWSLILLSLSEGLTSDSLLTS